MKRLAFVTIALALALTALAPRPALAQNEVTLAQVRAVTAAFHRTGAAQAAGYDLVPGLDYCFNNQPTGGMGYHYINLGILDTTLDPLHPEAMVYAPDSRGKLQLGAVEYITPIDAWDAIHSQPPMMFGQTFDKDVPLGVYTLHVWLWKHNPRGVFSEWNPKVTCP